MAAILSADFEKPKVPSDRERIFQLEIEATELRREVAALRDLVEVLLLTPAYAGTLPPKNEIEQLIVQIFNPEVPKGGHQPWDVQIAVFHRGAQVATPVRADLFPKDALLATAREHNASAFAVQAIQEMPEGSLGGFVRFNQTRSGRPYAVSQLIILCDPVTQPDMYVVIDDALIEITEFAPRNRKAKADSFLWKATWAPERNKAKS